MMFFWGRAGPDVKCVTLRSGTQDVRISESVTEGAAAAASQGGASEGGLSPPSSSTAAASSASI